MSERNVVDLVAAQEHRAKVLANKRLRRAHPSEWLRYFEAELARSRGGNPEPDKPEGAA